MIRRLSFAYLSLILRSVYIVCISKVKGKYKRKKFLSLPKIKKAITMNFLELAKNRYTTKLAMRILHNSKRFCALPPHLSIRSLGNSCL